MSNDTADLCTYGDRGYRFYGSCGGDGGVDVTHLYLFCFEGYLLFLLSADGEPQYQYYYYGCAYRYPKFFISFHLYLLFLFLSVIFSVYCSVLVEFQHADIVYGEVFTLQLSLLCVEQVILASHQFHDILQS